MRFPLITVLCMFLSVSWATESFAQEFVPTPVEISQEKVNVNGDIYYLHKVLKGQTLYSISKAYGVSLDELQNANQSLSEGLKAGMLLYIPVVPDPEAAKVSAAGTAESVQAAQDRPEDNISASQTQKKKKNYRKYNVKWYETLEDAAKKFDVTVESIIKLNGIDTASGKRIRGILIPDQEYVLSLQTEASSTDTEPETDGPETSYNGIEYSYNGTYGSSEMYDKGPYVISLVLPFNASKKTDNINTYASDFYAGALAAAAELKEQGLFGQFVLNAVDLNNYSSSWEMISDGALKGSELIIGPISERDLQPVANYGRSRNIPVVSPLDLKTAGLLENNPWLFLFPPQSGLALPHQMDKVAEHYSRNSGQVTVIYEQGTDNSSLVSETFSELQKRGIQFTTFKYDFLNGRGIDTAMRRILDRHAMNEVIIPSMSEAFITDAMRNLNLLKSSGYRIEVYGQSRWKSFETIESNYFHALDLRLAMSYHINYNDSLTVNFINRYRAAFNTEPSSFAFQGYDIMTFFVKAMNRYGKAFPQAIINRRESLLQSDVLFLPVKPGSGYENHAFKDICFTRGWVILDE